MSRRDDYPGPPDRPKFLPLLNPPRLPGRTLAQTAAAVAYDRRRRLIALKTRDEWAACCDQFVLRAYQRHVEQGKDRRQFSPYAHGPDWDHFATLDHVATLYALDERGRKQAAAAMAALVKEHEGERHPRPVTAVRLPDAYEVLAQAEDGSNGCRCPTCHGIPSWCAEDAHEERPWAAPPSGCPTCLQTQAGPPHAFWGRVLPRAEPA